MKALLGIAAAGLLVWVGGYIAMAFLVAGIIQAAFYLFSAIVVIGSTWGLLRVIFEAFLERYNPAGANSLNDLLGPVFATVTMIAFGILLLVAFHPPPPVTSEKIDLSNDGIMARANLKMQLMWSTPKPERRFLGYTVRVGNHTFKEEGGRWVEE